jgi:hypothetical protein
LAHADPEQNPDRHADARADADADVGAHHEGAVAESVESAHDQPDAEPDAHADRNAHAATDAGTVGRPDRRAVLLRRCAAAEISPPLARASLVRTDLARRGALAGAIAIYVQVAPSLFPLAS